MVELSIRHHHGDQVEIFVNCLKRHRRDTDVQLHQMQVNYNKYAQICNEDIKAPGGQRPEEREIGEVTARSPGRKLGLGLKSVEFA